MTPADLVAAVNALPSNTARLDCAQHLRAFYGWPDVDAHDLPHALAAVASFDTPQGATAEKTGQTGDSPSRPVLASEAHTDRPIRDASPEARADRLAAGVATIRLTQEIASEIGAPGPGWPDLRPSNFYSPDSGPRMSATVDAAWFVPGSESRMSEVERERWFAAWLKYGRTCAARWEWEAERSGRRTVRVLADADSQAF